MSAARWLSLSALTLCGAVFFSSMRPLAQIKSQPAAANAAQPIPDSVFLEELTWTEVRDGMMAGKTTVIVPTGGTEQGGPHVVLGKENYVVTYASGEIAKRLGNAYVAPTLAYVPEGRLNPPSGHMRFPGSITLPDEAFVQVLVWAGRSFKAGGFKNIVLLGNSGGNQDGLEAAARQLNIEFAGSDVRVHFIPDYYYSTAPKNAGELSPFDQWIIDQGIPKGEIGSHVGVRDTSTLMAVEAIKYRKGQLVRWDKLANGGGFTGSGVTGNPTYANVKFGERGLEIKIDAAVKQIQTLMAHK
jgi:creatinine amidohydrolase